MRVPHFLFPCIVAGTSFLLLNCGGNGESNSSSGTKPDAAVADIPIAYVKRSVPFDEDGEFINQEGLNPSQFVPGAELFVRERADANAAEINLTDGLFPEGELYDVKDLVASNDGTKLLFAMRAPELENVDPDEQPTWNIWEYNLETETLRRVIANDITAEDGQDVSPAYLPDGRIVFASNRQLRSKAILLDDGKPQYEAQTDNRREDGFVLHVMDEDGANISQLTYNQSHDYQPLVLASGQIAYNRWSNKEATNRLSLFTTRPDGQDTQELYGYNSQSTGTDGADAIFYHPRVMADGRLLAVLRARESSNWGGDLVAIDIDNYSDINQDVNQPITDEPGLAGDLPGQESLAFGDIIVDDDPTTISLNGYFAAATDLFDDTARLLVAWSDCRLQDPDDDTRVLACLDSNLAIADITEARPLYSLWIYNLENNTLQPLFAATPGYMYTDVVAFGPRAEDTFLADRQGGVELDQGLVDNALAELHIRNVYEVAGVDIAGISLLADPALTTADDRPARFLKIEKAVSLPDRDVYDFDGSAFGFANNMREIIGYVPVEPDGSVKTLIPTDVALAVSITNALGQRISGTTSVWFSARPGERIESNDLSVGLRRLDATHDTTNPGAPMNGYHFPNTEPLLIAQAGETMAEAWSRMNGTRRPSVDLIFNDDWTDTAVRAKDASFSYLYANLLTAAPASDACQSEWVAACRTVINYQDHIQPLWDLDRPPDAMNNVITCIACHSRQDAMGATQVPAGQLELTQSQLDTNNHYRSFEELAADDIVYELDAEGILVPVMVPVPEVDADGNIVYETDLVTGDLILDGNGDPIPVIQMTTVTEPRALIPGNAAGSRFFDLFAAGGSHAGYLSNDELKLIGEWIDLGGQYYNNPFDAPEN
ncbi:hypothetical protein [Halioxenophilus sp. WMMB6]|uniref:HzsA-related protein n=1 Tax=Halioxenophilus sp. WMMB6 TaxID=3073815 RepID=UPI00295E7DCB|nr:hypothetical protein [Halioxenophilus sp. WMMB6]